MAGHPLCDVCNMPVDREDYYLRSDTEGRVTTGHYECVHDHRCSCPIVGRGRVQHLVAQAITAEPSLGIPVFRWAVEAWARNQALVEQLDAELAKPTATVELRRYRERSARFGRTLRADLALTPRAAKSLDRLLAQVLADVI